MFDPSKRYATPGHALEFGEQGAFIDPFELYGLDSDTVPKKIDPDDHYPKRDVPANAWDALAANRIDSQNLRDNSFSSIRGHWATNIPKLPRRLNQIGVWFSKISDQPTSVWWAASQTGLHPDIQHLIKWELGRSQNSTPSVIRQAWWYLFDAWEEKINDFHGDCYELKAMIDKNGWDSFGVRKYAATNRPYLKAEKNYFGGPKPPEKNKDLQIGNLIRLRVEYRLPPFNAKIPDEWLEFAISELRKNLELALQLETELGGYGLNNLSPTIPYDGASDDSSSHMYGLSASVKSFTSLFERLIELDISKARYEFAAWPMNDDTIFARLKMWASMNSDLVPARSFGQLITSLSDNAFWDSYHQRDFLLVLVERWKGLPDDIRKKIENRFLSGRAKRNSENDNEYEERRAWKSLDRITWLAKNGCNFSFDFAAETKRLRTLAPEWLPKYAEKAAEYMGVRGGTVRTDIEHALLLREPLNSILSKAKELSGKTEDFLVENDPFAGLSSEHPVRAFTALTYAARKNEYPEWAWRTFLNSESKNNGKPRFSALIAERISRYPDNAVMGFIHPASDWILSTSKKLVTQFPRTFEKVIPKLINVLPPQSSTSNTVVVRSNKEPDWTMEAVNSPVGKIARALFNDPRKDDLKADGGFPDEWLAYVEALLSLSDDLRRYAIVIFSHNLNWFYFIDPNWTEINLLSAINGNNVHDRDAFWSGFFWGARVPSQKLYMRMKSSLLMIAKDRSLSGRRYYEILAGIILSGWGTNNEDTQERFISNDEMRDVLLHADDDFRSYILWQIERWSETKENGTDEKWSDMMPEFFRNAWPRQKSAKTPAILTRLCEVVFSNVKCFPELVEIVLPLLTIIDNNHLTLPSLRKSTDNIVDLYPHHTLALLHAILPDNVVAWPYNIEETLCRISEADSSLNSDERLLELKRKWNAR